MNRHLSNASARNVDWHKSSYSGANSNCVEAGRLATDTVVRDSKDPAGPALAFSAQAWNDFLPRHRRFNGRPAP